MVTNNYQRFNPYPLLLFLLLFLFAAFFLASCPGSDDDDSDEEGDDLFIPDGWNYKILSRGSKESSNIEIDVDQYFNISIVYIYGIGNYRRQIRNISNKSSEWLEEIIDEDVAPRFAFTLDNDGFSHISYNYDVTFSSNSLIYSDNISGNWNNIIIGDDSGGADSIALDSTGNVYISVTGGIVWLWSNSSGDWLFDEIANSGNNSSLAINSDNNIFIAFNTDYSAKFAFKTNNKWYFENIFSFDTQYWMISDCELRIGSQGTNHVFFTKYYDDGEDNRMINESILYAIRSKGEWSTTEIMNDAWFQSFDLDSDDRPHFLYQKNKSLFYAFPQNGDWNTEKVGNGVNGSIVLDINDNVHIIYYSDSYNDDFNLIYLNR